MNEKSQGLTKVCSHCGESKPLSAFLQLSETGGAFYGSVCANCRKAHIEQKARMRESGESTTSTTGFKIDAKAKVQLEKDKREQRKEQKEQELKDKEKQEENKSLKQESRHRTTSDQKKHREQFLEKRSFLDRSNKEKAASAQKVFGGEAHKAEAGKLDFAAGPVEYTRIAGTLKTTSPIFQAFKSWLGNAPIVSAAEKAAKASKTAKQETKEQAKDAFNAHIEKNYRPKSR